MVKDKYDFIKQLLETEKLSPTQKERVLLLSAKEISDNTGLEARVSKIEEIVLKDVSLIEKKVFIPSKLNKNIKIANPFDVASFMSLFNDRTAFKYLTHDFDEGGDFDINQFLKLAQIRFKKETNKNKFAIPTGLWTLINNFAFEVDKHWSLTQKNKQGFSSLEWIKWSNENKLHPIRNTVFKEYINKFRLLTRISAPQLQILIGNVLKDTLLDNYQNFEIKLTKIDKADFYTNVEFFRKALDIIFEEINNRNQSKKIEISLDRYIINDFHARSIVITHFDSCPDNDFEVLLKEWTSGEKGAMGAIYKNLEGYCHWSVETKIDDKCVRINILKEEESPQYELIETEKVVGFKHILTFYYK